MDKIKKARFQQNDGTDKLDCIAILFLVIVLSDRTGAGGSPKSVINHSTYAVTGSPFNIDVVDRPTEYSRTWNNGQEVDKEGCCGVLSTVVQRASDRYRQEDDIHIRRDRRSNEQYQHLCLY